MKINVLVVSGGGFQGLTIVKELNALDAVQVFLADSYEENVSKYFSHKSFTVLPVAHPGFISSLLKICREENIHLIIPSTNHELKILSEARELFLKDGIQVALSKPPLLKIFSDKKLFYEFLESHHQPVLPLLNSENPDLKFPVIGKPRGGWGGNEILRIHDRNSLEQLSRSQREELVWQECLVGFDEVSIDFSIGFNGKISDPNFRKRIRTSGGFAVVMETLKDEKLSTVFNEFAKLISGLEAVGLFNMQVLVKDGNYVISDFNPRMGTSAVMWKVNDNNLCRFLIQSMPGNESRIGVENNEKNYGSSKHKIVRYLDELIIPSPDLSVVTCLVFDLDDTLMPQKKWMFEKLKLVHEQFKNILPPKKEFLTMAMSFVEEGHRKYLIDEIMKQAKIDSSFRDEIIEAYRKAHPAQDFTFPETYFVLNELKKKYKLVLLTDNPVASQKQKLASTQLEEYFDELIFTDELGVSKPDGRTFQAAANAAKQDVKTLAMVGDNLYRDISAALASGYAYGFYLQRNSSMFNFDGGIFHEVMGERRNYSAIENMKQLLWYL